MGGDDPTPEKIDSADREGVDSADHSSDAGGLSDFNERGRRALEAIVATGDVEGFFTVLERMLSRPLEPSTFYDLTMAVSPFAGKEMDARFLLQSLSMGSHEGRESRLEQLGVSEDALKVGRRVIALHGAELRLALVASYGYLFAHDWESTDGHLLSDADGDFLLELSILKRNREVVELRMYQDSALRLVGNILHYLQRVPSDRFEADLLDQVASDIADLSAPEGDVDAADES